MRLLPFSISVGIQRIGREDLEAAARAGRRIHGLFIGWVHLSHRVDRELAAQALGRVWTLGIRTGFRRVQ